MNTRSHKTTVVPKCPPNGLSRAEWFRWLAAEVEVTDPQRAIHCRRIAEMIERGVFATLPLIARMTDSTDDRA